MNAKDKITKAKVKLVLDYPFWATLALGVAYIEDPSVGTACTNGKEIRYNPTFIDILSVEEMQGVIAHEVMHIAFLHMTRRQGRDPFKFNVACDFVINPIIIDAGMKLPKGALIEPAYKGKSAEEVYRLLPDDPQSKNNPDSGGCGAVIDAPAGTQAELDQIEAEAKQLLSQAAIVAKQQGKLPAGMERFIEEVMQPKILWKEVLQRFLTQVVHSDYTWTKPNKRYLHSGLYLPALESIESGDFILIVDTSGSIGMHELSQFAAEMQDIAGTFKTGFKIIWIDSRVQAVQEVEPDEDFVLKPAGGGGTDMVPAFDWIEEHDLHPSAVVCFTDGYFSTFPKAHDFPILWAVLDNKSFTAPVGEVLHIQSGDNF